jgi:hypothetical protein
MMKYFVTTMSYLIVMLGVAAAIMAGSVIAAYGFMGDISSFRSVCQYDIVVRAMLVIAGGNSMLLGLRGIFDFFDAVINGGNYA